MVMSETKSLLFGVYILYRKDTDTEPIDKYFTIFQMMKKLKQSNAIQNDLLSIEGHFSYSGQRRPF